MRNGLATLLMLLLALPVWGNDDEFSSEVLSSIGQQLDVAESSFLQNAQRDMRSLDSLNASAAGLEQRATACITAQEQRQAQNQQAIDSLGEAIPDEDLEVKRKRKELSEQKQQIEKTLAQCRLLSLRAATLITETRSARQAILKKQLFARTYSLLEHVTFLLLNPRLLPSEIAGLTQTLLALPLAWRNVWLALAYAGAGLLLGWLWSWRKHRQYRQEIPTIHATSPTLAAVWLSLVRIMPLVLLTGLGALSLRFAPAGAPALLQFMQAGLLFTLSYGILSSLLRMTANVEGVIPADRRAAAKLYFWAQWLIIATLMGVLLHSALLDNLDGDSTQPNNLIGLLRIFLGSIIGFALARLVWLMSQHFLFIQRTRLHLLSVATLVIAVLSLWLGYRNFSTFLFSGVFGTLFLLLGAWLILKITGEVFDGLDAELTPWQQRWRQQLGLKSGQPTPGMLWLRLSITLLVSGAVLVALLRLWGMPEHDFTLLLGKLATGFKIAGFTLEPLRIIGGLLVLALLVSLTHVFKKNLAEHWLQRTTLSRGAREAILTVSGYGGVVIALLIGLSVAGIQLQNLAIIAGALSVGIGFGLQNIVNNFVSGLILLFERPVRKGDWIKTGSAEGYVRDISIRSTTIQTFDRSHIIIPNSELITKPVSNMVLNDRSGRLAISVTVRHESDAQLVMQLMQAAAQAHPNVLQERKDAPISVFFREFSDLGLVFELRCFVKDVETRMRVTSDLNLAINQAFHENGIHLAGRELPASG